MPQKNLEKSPYLSWDKIIKFKYLGVFYIIKLGKTCTIDVLFTSRQIGYIELVN